METPIDDSALLTKLEFEAGTTNSDILTDPEKKRARALMSETEGVLASLDQEIELELVSKRQQVEGRLSWFRIALAPHKCVPLEILADIFVHALNGSEVNFPPRLTELPWILGRVCSSWRQITRNEPRLWNDIRVHTDTFYGRRVTQFIPFFNHYVPPSRASLSITFSNVYESPSWHTVDQLIAPNLSRIKHLSLHIPVSAFTRLFGVAPERLSTLESLKLDLQATHHHDIKHDTIGEKFTRATVFRNANRLRKLDLSSGGDVHFSGAMLCLPFPWSALTSLRLTQLQILTLPNLHRTLRQCSSLVDLFAKFCRSRFVEPFDTAETLQLHNLRCVEMQGEVQTQDSLPDLQLPWDRLTTLLLFDFLSLSLLEAHTILRRCTHVEVLSLTVQAIGSVSDILGGAIVLPNLRYLKVRVDKPDILACFILPVLDTLILDSNSLPVHEVRDLFVRSSCSLSTFAYHGGRCSDPHEMTSLLALMSSIRDFQLKDVCLRDDVMQGIASGELLPHVIVLRCQLLYIHLKRFIDVLEMRREAEMGVELRSATAVLDEIDEPWLGDWAEALTEKNVMDVLRQIEALNNMCGTDFALGVVTGRSVLSLAKQTPLL